MPARAAFATSGEGGAERAGARDASLRMMIRGVPLADTAAASGSRLTQVNTIDSI